MGFEREKMMSLLAREAELLDNYRCLADTAVQIVPRIARGAVVDHLTCFRRVERNGEPQSLA